MGRFAFCRTDSDFFLPYGFLSQKKELPEDLDTAIAEFGLSHTHLVGEKEAKAAWFVSHCETESRREKYVAQLQQFYPVEIYGACGEFECKREMGGECWQMVEQKYKYYLAFENSVCGDYVTEKLFDALKVTADAIGLVQYYIKHAFQVYFVLLGGAH